MTRQLPHRHSGHTAHPLAGPRAGAPRHPGSPVALACTLLVLSAQAQAQEAATAQPAQVITITGQATPAAPALTGFGNQSLADTPMQVQAINQEELLDAGVDTLADVTRFDASMADAYNTTGYWQSFSIRTTSTTTGATGCRSMRKRPFRSRTSRASRSCTA